jgi:hypothetical protein
LFKRTCFDLTSSFSTSTLTSRPHGASTLTSSSPHAAIPHVARRYRPAAAASLLPRPERAAPASASNVRGAPPTTRRLASPTTTAPSSLHASAGQSPTTWHATATAERNRIPERDTDCQSSSRPCACRLPSLRTESHDQRPIRDGSHHAVSTYLAGWKMLRRSS